MSLSALLRIGGDPSQAAARGVRRATILVGSQKTLPVAVAVLGQLGNALGQPGVVLLPLVVTHLLQIVMDSVLVSTWLKEETRVLKTA
eukprot:scaffold1074_cov409-Prasinococcus_capsulatus_cf.AAC.14